MHLWPSTRLRDSFKQDYLKKLEWNLKRMKAEKNQSAQDGLSNQTKLLNQNHGDGDVGPSNGDGSSGGGALMLCTELLMIFSCCYCCFCCGACSEHEEN